MHLALCRADRLLTLLYWGQVDLIGKAKETRTDRRKREELHRQWAEQRDAKELQQVLKGLKQGFRRKHRDGFMDDEVRLLVVVPFTATVCCVCLFCLVHARCIACEIQGG